VFSLLWYDGYFCSQELARAAAVNEGEAFEGITFPDGRPIMDHGGRALPPPRPPPRPPPLVPCCPVDLQERPSLSTDVNAVQQDENKVALRDEKMKGKEEVSQRNDDKVNGGREIDEDDNDEDEEPVSEPLWGASPAASWVEAYPIGNGILGALVKNEKKNAL